MELEPQFHIQHVLVRGELCSYVYLLFRVFLLTPKATHVTFLFLLQTGKLHLWGNLGPNFFWQWFKWLVIIFIFMLFSILITHPFGMLSWQPLTQSGRGDLIWCRKHISGPCSKQLDRKYHSNLQQTRAKNISQLQMWLAVSSVCLLTFKDKCTKLFKTALF